MHGFKLNIVILFSAKTNHLLSLHVPDFSKITVLKLSDLHNNLLFLQNFDNNRKAIKLPEAHKHKYDNFPNFQESVI